MWTPITDTLDAVRQPQYTGENRCTPCTAVNVVVALVLGVGVSAVLTSLVGALAFVGALAVVYLRGYLVPGTPAFTERYFPDRLLAWFDKGPARPRARAESPSAASTSSTAGVDSAGTIDPEATLSTADAIEPCPDEDDLCLTPSFAAAWSEESRRLRDETARRTALEELFETDEAAISVETDGGHVTVFDGDTPVGRWPSEGAMVADLAADRALASWAGDWTTVALERRFGVLAGLRSFLETCPTCGGPVELGERTVESCCRSWEVVAVRCTECATDLLELDPETLETVA